MRKLNYLLIASLAAILSTVYTPPANAQNASEQTAPPDIQKELDQLEVRADEQDKLIAEQQRMLNRQSEQISEQKKLIDSLTHNLADKKVKGEQPPKAASAKSRRRNTSTTAAPPLKQESPTSLTSSQAPERSAESQQRPQVQALADQGGILSHQGMLTFESTTEYTNTTRNIFTFNGVQLAQVVLVGAVNDTSARHQIVQQTGRLRLGLTNRMEADIHIPYVYRNDGLTNTSTTTGAVETTSLQGSDIGDIDAGLAYQLNDGKEGWPFLIGNLRYKANNAEGPYDIPYTANNIAERLPTGTGFQTIEASVTAIKVSDPAVLFANLGYVYDVPRDINHAFNSTYIQRVEPGDAVNALVGVGFAINQDTSFSLGYKQSYVFPTIQHSLDTTNGNKLSSSTGSSQVGALTLGLSHAFSPTNTVNFSVEAGVTNDAPDVHLSLRIPFQLGKIF